MRSVSHFGNTGVWILAGVNVVASSGLSSAAVTCEYSWSGCKLKIQATCDPEDLPCSAVELALYFSNNCTEDPHDSPRRVQACTLGGAGPGTCGVTFTIDPPLGACRYTVWKRVPAAGIEYPICTKAINWYTHPATCLPHGWCNLQNTAASSCDPLDIPTVSQWGLVCLSLLLLVAGTVLVRSRVSTQEST